METTTATTRFDWTEKRSAKDVEEYMRGLRDSLPLYPGNVTVELVSVEDGETKSGRKRFTIRLERDALEL
jgi:hypothetical protein